MKRALLVILSAVALVAAFVGGAIASIRYVGNPLVEHQLKYQHEVFHNQVFALKRLTEGSPQEAEQVLRSLNIYGLSVLTIDESETGRTKNSPALRDAVAYACKDALSHINESLYSAHERARVQEACRTLQPEDNAGKK